jgi:hypothetical protein
MKRVIVARKDRSCFYYEQEFFEKADSIGIIFSGDHYTISNPFLYYSRNILFEKKIDYIGFNFDYSSNKKYVNGNDAYQKSINEEDCSLTFSLFKEIEVNYKKIFLIAKSSGLKHILKIAKYSLSPKLCTIIFTPGFDWKDYIESTSETAIVQLIIAGTKDKLFKVENLEMIEKNIRNKIVLLDNADHSLEVDNIVLDLSNLCNVMNIVEKYIDNNTR